MTRRKSKAEASASASPDPTEFVGRNEKGSIRPADDRYLDAAEVDARDAYLLEVTGQDAQQLVAKRQALRVLLDGLSDAALREVAKGSDGLEGRGRVEILDLLEASATTMPTAQYRDLLADLEAHLEDADQVDQEEES